MVETARQRKAEATHARHMVGRLMRAATKDGFSSIDEFAQRPDSYLRRLPNFGERSLKRLRELTGTKCDGGASLADLHCPRCGWTMPLRCWQGP